MADVNVGGVVEASGAEIEAMPPTFGINHRHRAPAFRHGNSIAWWRTKSEYTEGRGVRGGPSRRRWDMIGDCRREMNELRGPAARHVLSSFQKWQRSSHRIDQPALSGANTESSYGSVREFCAARIRNQLVAEIQ